MLQADVDIGRAKKLFKDEDFGFAAYSAQQGLEKYMKAYLLRLEIFDDPQNLGHLQYPQILREMGGALENFKKTEEPDSPGYNLINSYSKFINEYANTIELITEYAKKILFWKASLGIELNFAEKKIDEGIGIKLSFAAGQFSNSFHEFLIPALTAISPQSERPIDPVIVEQFSMVLVRLLEIAEDPDSADVKEVFDLLDRMIKIIKPIFYGTGSNSIPKETTDDILKLYFLARTMPWMPAVQYSFPHEDIGRYPTNVNGISSIEIYKDRKENLWDLIQGIDATCMEIKGILIDMMA